MLHELQPQIFYFFPFIVDSTVTVFRGLNFEYIPVSLEARAPLTVLLAPAIVNGIPRGSLLTRGPVEIFKLTIFKKQLT